MQTADQSVLLWIVLFPLLGAIINGFFGAKADKRLITAVGVGTVAISFVLAVVAFCGLYVARAQGEENVRFVFHVYQWFSLQLPQGTVLPVNIRFSMDALSGLMALVVTGIGGLIHLYSVGYMHEDPSYSRFFAYLNLFTASMLILILASNLPLMFVGWEGVGLCSYLLIGFWFENPAYAAAGRKAFVVNRIGDFGVLLGMLILAGATGSFEFAQINAQASVLNAQFMFAGLSMSLATAACLFLFLGCAGKSAQLPLYVWLPDAMAGPTPVSALIHAATMVTAGVYLCCRLSPVFAMSEVAMATIAIVGTLTALLAASIALVQNELKKILAYSTVSQLGFMFAAVGMGAFAAGFFHVFTHAFFKACLFLGAGSVMHAVHAHGDADVRKLGGLKSVLPITWLTFLVSCLAIAGVPMFSGFFSKDEILLGATSNALHAHSAEMRAIAWFVFGGLTLSATMTAFYMFRLYFLTFHGSYRGHTAGDDHGYAEHPHEAPASMAFPLWVLGFGALAAGYLGLPHIVPFVGTHLPNWWGHWLAPVVYSHGSHDAMDAINLAAAAGIGAMLVGISIAAVMYRSGQPRPVEHPRALYRLLLDKWRVDELYQTIIVSPIKATALAVGRADFTFVDGLLTRLPAWKVRTFGSWLVRMQNGVVQWYGVVFLFGVVAIVSWITVPHASIEVQRFGARYVLKAEPGYGYQYRWDFNGDGEFDTTWQTSPTRIVGREESTAESAEFTVEVKNAFGIRAQARGSAETKVASAAGVHP